MKAVVVVATNREALTKVVEKTTEEEEVVATTIVVVAEAMIAVEVARAADNSSLKDHKSTMENLDLKPNFFPITSKSVPEMRVA